MTMLRWPARTRSRRQTRSQARRHARRQTRPGRPVRGAADQGARRRGPCRRRGERADDRFGPPVRRRLERPDLGEQAGGGGPLAGILGQAALDQRPDFGRHPVKAGVAVDHAVQQRGRGPGAERALARGGEGQQRPEAEDVGRRPDLVTHGLLGGHEPGRADHQARLRQRRGFHRAGDAEVDDPRAVVRDQHVRRLEVPVHHARGVDRAEALRQARGQRQQRPRRTRPVVRYRPMQRRPGDISRGQPRRRPVDVGVHHHGREYSAHPAGRVDLPPEPVPELRIRGQLSPDDLHRYRPAARGDAEENPPHARRQAGRPAGTDRSSGDLRAAIP